MSLYMERCDPSENAFRYYDIEVGQDLFGTWCVTRRWGRIGTVGQHKIDSFPGRSDAALFGLRTSARKQKRGYQRLLQGGEERSAERSASRHR